ncbi:MAG TPA: hypothetical protein RMH99_31700, partial [Sandaracinaceae bacterium LLY-WYZ-13_1]|nr:hypothetical protein [Sandaracinaceae bacterium LLY-WYZ-13_1]
MRSVLALTAALLGAAPAAASADGLPAPALREARQALSSYDVNGGTVEVIGELSSFLSEAQGADAREARFLRAVAAADLVLIARGQRRDDVPARVAEALGVERDRLVSFLRTELGHLDLGVYAPVARECRWALDALERREEDPAFLRDGRGERRDVLFVNAVVDALGAPEEIRRLAAFGADPCAEDAECPTAAFSATGRRAIEALREAHAALGRLEHIQSTGEPLAASLAAITTVDGAVLRTSAIR